MDQIDIVTLLPWIAFFLGIISRIFIPWLAKRRKDPANAQWGWVYVWPQLLSVVLIVLILPLVMSDFNAISTMAWAVAWVTGWGAADIGRQTYKMFENEVEE